METDERTFVPTFPVWFVLYADAEKQSAIWGDVSVDEGRVRCVFLFTDAHEADSFMCNHVDKSFLTAYALEEKSLIGFLDRIEAQGVKYVAFDPQPPRAPFVVSIDEIRRKHA
jgi:hypothetical protein